MLIKTNKVLMLFGLLLIGAALIVCGIGLFNWYNAQREIISNANRMEKEINDGQSGNMLIFHLEKSEKKVAVYDGTSDIELKKGAGRISGSAKLNEKGNCILFGHRDSAFRVFKKINIGDKITAITEKSKLQYQVVSIDIFEPDKIPMEKSETTKLTLVTCYPLIFSGPAPKRMVVVANAI